MPSPLASLILHRGHVHALHVPVGQAHPTLPHVVPAHVGRTTLPRGLEHVEVRCFPHMVHHAWTADHPMIAGVVVLLQSLNVGRPYQGLETALVRVVRTWRSMSHLTCPWGLTSPVCLCMFHQLVHLQLLQEVVQVHHFTSHIV